MKVARNDWSTIPVPDVSRWQPDITVSVIIPAYNCGRHLELTLAALSRQSFPAELLEVVVVDDGSEPPLMLPEIRPSQCRIVTTDASARGIANALDVGVRNSSGEVIHRLDADMVVDRHHVAALARWVRTVPYAVAMGHKEFLDIDPASPRWPGAVELVEAAGLDAVFAGVERVSHPYHEMLLTSTDNLRRADHQVFMAHVGASVAVHRDLYARAGGYDTSLQLGEDTEFGFRLAQAGAVFIPDDEARAWHLGRTTMMGDVSRVQRVSRPHLADRMPQPRWLRRSGGTRWAIPLVVAVTQAGDEPFERVRAAVDALLKADERDVEVYVVGPWDRLGESPRRPLADPDLDLRLVVATYQSDPRVHLVETAPEPFPSPYLLMVPPATILGRSALSRLIQLADEAQAGLVRADTGASSVELWRTAALSRARVAAPDEAPADAVAAMYGVKTVLARSVGIADGRDIPIEALARGVDVTSVAGSGRYVPTTVEVGGIRSLARAAVVVARNITRKAFARYVRDRVRSTEIR